MQFLYLDEDLTKEIVLKNESFKYIIKVRRKKEGEILHVRNLKDDNLYTYKLKNIEKKSAVLEFLHVKKIPKKGGDFKLCWAVIDPKIIEKTLPMLNEMGVGGVDFIYTKFSQKNFKIDLSRLKRILISSCEQCGRSDLMSFKIYPNLKTYMEENSDFYVVDFGGKTFSKDDSIKKVLVGCEGGFSEDERLLFDKEKVLGFDSDLILRSQSAVCAVVSKLLL